MTTTNGLKGNIEQVKDMLTEAGIDLTKQLEVIDDEQLGYAVAKPSGELDNVLYIDQIPDLIKWQILNPELHSHTMLIMGPSAIGKTLAVRQGFDEAARVMNRTPELHELHVSQMGPTDVMGVPREDGHGRTVWYPPKMFPLVQALPQHEADYQKFLAYYQRTGTLDHTIMHEHKQYGLFLDEITNPSQPSIVHQLFSIIYGRYVADHQLVSDTFVCAAGNRVQDGTNSIYLAKSATARFMMFEALPRLSGWLTKWAMRPMVIAGEEFTREHPLVIAYLHRFSDRFAPDTTGLPQMTPFPSPRNWSYVSQALYANDRMPLPDNVLFAAVAGRIGQAEARLFWSFRDHWKDLPDINRMLNSPAEKDSEFGWLPMPWPKRPDLLVIMGTQMVSKLNAKNAKRFMAFMLDTDKFPPEMAAMTMKLLRPADKLQVLAHEWAPAEFANWASKYRHYLF